MNSTASPVLEMTREEILAQAEQHYYLAMLDGWVKGNVSEVPHRHQMQSLYEYGDFSVMDRYNVLDGVATGTVLIKYQERPVWSMSYSGQYLAEDLPLLKCVLTEIWQTGTFIGGRGPHRSKLDDRTYTNEVLAGSDFNRFRGVERILGANQEMRGYHSYSGERLI